MSPQAALAERLARRGRPAPPETAAVAATEAPCVACGFVLSVTAQYCRRCGGRQPRDRDVATAIVGERPVTDRAADVTNRAIPDGAAAISDRAIPDRAVPDRAVPDRAVPRPADFRSFASGSTWVPRPGDDPVAPAADPPVEAAARRCTHPQRGRATVMTCTICGGVPGPRVVSARVDGVGRLPAEMSAEDTLSPRQRRAILIGLAVLAGIFVVAPLATLIALITAATLLYAAVAIQRVLIFWLALDQPEMISITDEEARAIPASKLPIYTILIPAYREPEVIGRLLDAVRALDYPIHKLDIKLLLEQDDPETLEAALAARPGPHLEIVRIPPVGPRTKPKACQVGLARARGQYVTIFDAEDQPERLQLRRAIAAFRRHRDIACLQAILSYRNAGQNLITRWFTAEYAMWFRQFLPGLVRLGAPLPLGGTSNHFRRRVLREVGGWDPFNVTEDADLGIRLTRAGHRVAVLQSTTMEEANSDFVNWVKQRSRWYKGYLQTWLIHLRQPRRLWRELGPRGFIGFNLFVGGTPLVAFLNPVFWGLTAIWFLAHPDAIQSLFPSWLYYAGLACLVGGNFVFLYGSMVSARSTGRPDVVLAAALAPVYWVMMSIAALKAAIQLVSAPSFWEKTTHGLDLEPIARRLHDPST